MEMPEGYKIHVEHIQASTWCPSDDAAIEIFDLMKEMAEALHQLKALNDNEFGWRDPNISSIIDSIYEKFREWK